MSFLLGAVLVGLISAPAAPQTPIFQPGAPGAASRVISAESSVALSRSGFTPADVRFMQHMIVHHAQAVRMVELMQTRADDATVKLLGQRIALTQDAEMDLMRDWLLARAQPVEMAMDHGAHGHDAAPMPGMLTEDQMQALTDASGPAFDRLFLDGMIQHHRGAIAMVAELNRYPDSAEDPMLSDFANAVVADQSAEILRMRTLLSNLSNIMPEEAP